ncbi:hypothetical protein BpHYR1_036614 [Brachionus plicatilis]|uniref:Uncharacterized protein n=1 Tax=Brachionus plicatilis TaxID=10195 RepID=A0A3M7SHB5_BRAPC|nr:hypothetical protein BpHYR1_036614 [Brachionus plicatilis]
MLVGVSRKCLFTTKCNYEKTYRIPLREMGVDPNSVLSSIDSNETSNLNLKRIRYNMENKAKVLYFHKQGNSINKCAKHFSIDMRLKVDG